MLTNPRIYIDFWGWGDRSPNCTQNCFSDPYNEVGVIWAYLLGVGGTRWLNTVTQYSIGSQTPGSPIPIYVMTDGQGDHYWFNNTQVPKQPDGTVLTTDIRTEAANAAQHFGVQSDTQAIVMVLLPSTATFVNDGGNKACGFNNVEGPYNAPFIGISYMGNHPAACDDAGTAYGAIALTAHHEIAEAITDPNPAYPYTYAGWVGSTDGCEIADKCEHFPCFSSGGNYICPLPPTEQAIVAQVSHDWAGYIQVPALWSNSFNGGAGSCAYSYASRTDNWYLGYDGNYWHQLNANNSADNWGMSYSLGASSAYTTPPTAVSWGPNHFDVVGIDANSVLTELYTYTGGTPVSVYNWGYAPTYYYYYGRPEVTSWGPLREDLFVHMRLFSYYPPSMYHRSWDNGTDSGWVSIGNPAVGINSSPAAAAWGYNRIDVFVLGSDGNLYQSTSTDGSTFSSWVSVGAPSGVTLTYDPRASTWGPNRLDVMLPTTNGSIAHYRYDASMNPTTAWEVISRSGITFTAATPVGYGDQRFLTSAVRSSSYFSRRLWDDTAYGSWTDLSAYFQPIGSGSALATW